MGALLALGLAAPVSVVAGAVVLDAGTVAGVAYLLNQAALHSPAPPHSPAEDDLAFPLPQFLYDASYSGTVNIGIFGPSGVGKSTLINTLRAIRPGDPDAAEVGARETTMRPTMYKYLDVNAARLWDIPGAGTERFPAQTYIKDMGLRFFDVAILVTASRITEVDQAILYGLLEFRVPCFVVRSKIDIDIRNEVEDHGHDEKMTKQKLHEEMSRALSGVVDIYMVSKQPYEHDLPRLRHHLLAFVCANRRSLSESDCPICSEPFTIRAGGKNELITCRNCKSRLCVSCAEDLKNRLTGNVPCPFCCGTFRGPEQHRSQRVVEAAVLQRVADVCAPVDPMSLADVVPSSVAAAAAPLSVDPCIGRSVEDDVTLMGLVEGALVEIHGLTGAAHLNGKCGHLNGKTQADRLGVSLPPPDGIKALRPANLRVVLEPFGFSTAGRDIESGLHDAYY